MQASQTPTLIPLPWANSGTKNPIPLASQVGVKDGAASLTTGFPPLTFTPLAAGGFAPDGADFNGAFNLITQLQQWQSAGGQIQYDSAFATLVGGYPKGARVASSDGKLWRSMVDNNQNPPGAANWISDIGPQMGGFIVANASRTLTVVESQNNMVLINGNSGPLTLGMPVSSACENGAVISFENVSTYAVTLSAASGDVITTTSAGAPSIVLNPGDTLCLALNKTGSSWQTVAGSAQLQYLPQFGSSLGVNGFQKLPSGQIVQWGQATVGVSGVITISFPIAFPHGCLSCVAGEGNASSWGQNYAATYGVGTSTTSQISIYARANTNGAVAPPTSGFFNYIAIGW